MEEKTRNSNEASFKVQILFKHRSVDQSFQHHLARSRSTLRSSKARGLCSRIFEIGGEEIEDDDENRHTPYSDLCIKRVEEDDQYAPHSVEREILAYSILSEQESVVGSSFVMKLLAAFKDESDDFNTLFDLVMPWYPCTLQDLLNEPALQFVQEEEKSIKQPEAVQKVMQALSFITSPITFAQKVSFQLFSALDFLHSNGIAHRDVKPSNILLKPDGSNTIQLIDFGTCFLSKNRYSLGDDGKGGLASEVGTGSYRSPECLLSPLNGYDPYKVDIWQAGVTLSEFFLPVRHIEEEEDTQDPAVENEGDHDGVLDWERALWSKDDGEAFHELHNRFDTINGHSEEFFSVNADKNRKQNPHIMERESLFEGRSGDLGLANSIFNILGLPNGDAEGEAIWPEAVHFQPSLSRLPFKRRLPAEGGLKAHLLHYLPEKMKGDLEALAQVLDGCVQLSANKRNDAKFASEQLSMYNNQKN